MGILLLLSSTLYALAAATGETQAFVLPFFKLSENASVLDGVDDDTISFEFPTPFYFNNKTYSGAHISSNGLISFEKAFYDYLPERLPLDETYIIAPYWDDINLEQKGSISFESYDVNTDAKFILANISDFLTNSQGLAERYEPLSAVIIYWQDVCPYGNELCSNMSSFQAVLTSDDDNSYAIFTYECNSLNWNLHHATIGYSAGKDFYKNHIFSRKNNVNNIACLNEPDSPWSNVVYKVDEARGSECIPNSVRLVQGSDSHEGRAELCIVQFWHPLCDYLFTMDEADIICELLGYSFVEEITSLSTDATINFNEMYGVMCIGNETLLTDCLIDPCAKLSQPFIRCGSNETIHESDHEEAASSDTNGLYCTANCDPELIYQTCCNHENLGKFVIMEKTQSIEYVACPISIPDWCD